MTRRFWAGTKITVPVSNSCLAGRPEPPVFLGSRAAYDTMSAIPSPAPLEQRDWFAAHMLLRDLFANRIIAGKVDRNYNYI